LARKQRKIGPIKKVKTRKGTVPQAIRNHHLEEGHKCVVKETKRHVGGRKKHRGAHLAIRIGDQGTQEQPTSNKKQKAPVQTDLQSITQRLNEDAQR